MNTKYLTALSLATAMGLGCASGPSEDLADANDWSADAAPTADASTSDPHSYRTTSNIGDLSTWTIDGNTLTAEWKDIAPVTGAIEKTYNLTALCGSINVDFGHRTCLVDGNAVCTAGTLPCAAGDGPQDGETLTVYEVPGLALVVNVDNEDLHAGFAAGECAVVPTDAYSFVNIGLGQSDIFGVFRTDDAFSTIHHMDFGFSDDPANQLTYETKDPAGLVSGLTAGPCVDGIRDLGVDGTDDKVRVMITAAGHFLVDKPEGEGGMLAVNSQNAAVIGDFANKSFGGLSFPDDGPPELIKVMTGASANGRVLVQSIELSISGVLTPVSPVYINDGSAGAKLNETMLEPGEAYATNQIVIDGQFTGGPTEIPGLFEIDPVSGDETAIIGVGATVNGKTILFGSTVNQYDSVQNAVKGNFILVER